MPKDQGGREPRMCGELGVALSELGYPPIRTLSEVAEIAGVCRSTVHNVEKSVLRKLRCELAATAEEYGLRSRAEDR